MASDNEWLRLIYTQLSANAGGSGSSITQAQVQAAIEAAANLDQVEPYLNTIGDRLLAVQGATLSQAAVTAAVQNVGLLSQINNALTSLNALLGWRSDTLTTTSAGYVATGTGFEFTVPAGYEWQFQSAYIPFLTGATVANRVLRVYLSGVSGFYSISASRVAQVASQNRYYNVGLHPSLDVAIDNQYIYLPLPPVVLGAGDKIGVTVPAMVSGDSLPNPIIKIMRRTP